MELSALSGNGTQLNDEVDYGFRANGSKLSAADSLLAEEAATLLKAFFKARR